MVATVVTHCSRNRTDSVTDWNWEHFAAMYHKVCIVDYKAKHRRWLKFAHWNQKKDASVVLSLRGPPAPLASFLHGSRPHRIHMRPHAFTHTRSSHTFPLHFAFHIRFSFASEKSAAARPMFARASTHGLMKLSWMGWIISQRIVAGRLTLYGQPLFLENFLVQLTCSFLKKASYRNFLVESPPLESLQLFQTETSTEVVFVYFRSESSTVERLQSYRWWSIITHDYNTRS